jgi:hypothetical protein
LTGAEPIPTLRPVALAAGRTLRRFHVVLAAGFTAAAAAILSIEHLGDQRLTERLLVAATLGLPLFTALRVAGERRRVPPAGHVLLTAVGVGVLALVAALWFRWSDPVRFSRYLQLSVAFHLLVAIAPVTRRSEPLAFWQYNRLLFERFLAAVLYTVVLYAGLALALAAVDRLFGVDVPGTGYVRLWVTIAFVVNTWVFLAGVPRDLDALAGRLDYPPGLKVFAQYILIPIVVVYLVILSAYLAKVVITWDWPSGWIGWLVSGVAVVGILALLLVHPVAREAGNRWVAGYARGFFLVLLPSVLMLWLAIGQRVAQYGVTEHRYFLIVLSVWLGAIAVHQIVTRSRDIRVIPTTLCALALVTAAGPWGAYRVSERSQVRRLGGLLVRHGMLAEGRARPAPGPVPEVDRREIAAMLSYLAKTHGTGAIAPWFGGREALARIDTVARRTGPWEPGPWEGDLRARAITEWLGLEYVGWTPDRDDWFTYTADARAPISLAGYDFLLVVRHPSDSVTGPGLHARSAALGRSLEVYRDGVLLAAFPVDTLVRALRGRAPGPGRRTPVPVGELTLGRQLPGLSLSLQLDRIDGHWDHDTLRVREFSGVLLVGRR